MFQKLFISVNVLVGLYYYCCCCLVKWCPLVTAGLLDRDPTLNEINLNCTEIARLRGFLAEDYYFTTEDGYILNLCRINNPLYNQRSSTLRPVLFSHGLTQSVTYFVSNSVGIRPQQFDIDSTTDDELVNDPSSKSLPFLLSQFNYDVWLLNIRGTSFSLGHVNPREYPPTIGSKYWNFSMDEIIRYDIPGAVYYVRNVTNSDRVAYVGHSFANVYMMAYQTLDPDFGDNVVEPFISWSPDIYLKYSTTVLKPALVLLEPIMAAYLGPFPPESIDPLTRVILGNICGNEITRYTVCYLLEDSMWGFSKNQTELSAAVGSSQIYSVSGHTAAHGAQQAIRGKLYMYDYGPIVNMRRYGSLLPPLYNISRITSRSMSLYHADKDAVADPKDVARVIADLRVPFKDYNITQVPFNHYDFLFGRNVSLVTISSFRDIRSYDASF